MAVEKGPKHFTVNRQNSRLIFTIKTKSYFLASEQGGGGGGGHDLVKFRIPIAPINVNPVGGGECGQGVGI